MEQILFDTVWTGVNTILLIGIVLVVIGVIWYFSKKRKNKQ